VKLPCPSIDLRRDLAEFDFWITPSLGEIVDTDRFKDELASVVRLFELMGAATDNFKELHRCAPAAIAETFARIADGKSQDERSHLFRSLASTLFLVTGKSDNNAKCQFPLYLRDVAKWSGLPVPSRGSSRNCAPERPLPRTISSDDFMDLVAAIESGPAQSRLLTQFVSFLLMGENAGRQFWSLGRSFFSLKQLGAGYERNLLVPIVIFKVRGSVSASGGHRPEELLRAELSNWGLVPDLDFNTADVVVDEGGGGKDEKTRAYDFVIPYRTANWPDPWHSRIMVQSQFYAGDSGSVSHKNVDQTATSRQRVLAKFPSVRFVEYVDGAGYFSSLNGDLRKILAMGTTHSFLQIRSSPIRLRREIQRIGFLTPLEAEHAIVRTSGDVGAVSASLVADGYSANEVVRALGHAAAHGLIMSRGSKLEVRADRWALVRQYLLLDLVARHGRVLDAAAAASAGTVLVPGHGPFYGIEVDALVNLAVESAAPFRDDFSHAGTFSEDLKALERRGFAMMR
jgi:hypothetical protein